MTRRRTVISLVLLFVFLIPSAQFAWRNRDMPEFGYLHDDGVLFVSAKSLADGNGFRISNLPENPSQTKFPPLYPLFLSVIWKLDPNFPGNLQLAAFFGWILTALGLVLAWKLYQADGASEKRVWLLIGLLSVSPYWTLFGSMMFAEMLFTCFVLASIILARKSEDTRALVGAGLLAACAYLTRTAGVALILSVPVLFLWKKKWKAAAIFTAPPVIAAAVWGVWQMGHLPQSGDLTLLYYTDYMGFRKPNFGLDNMTVVLWKNLDQILYSIGALVLPKIVDLLPVKILTQVVGVAMIAGVVRMARRRISLDYALFSLVSVGILLIWHYPANERLVLPMFPLLLAGLVTEMEHFFGMLKGVLRPAANEPNTHSNEHASGKAPRKANRRQNGAGNRVVGAIFGGGVAALLVIAVGLQIFMSFSFLHASTAQQRGRLRERMVAYQWMRANLPAEAAVMSYDDPLVYLYSGHRGNYMPLLPRWWYAEDHKSMRDAYRNVAAYCRSRRLSYVYFTSEDLSREVGEEDRESIAKSIAANPELESLFTAGTGTVYRVRPEGSPSAQNRTDLTIP